MSGQQDHCRDQSNVSESSGAEEHQEQQQQQQGSGDAIDDGEEEVQYDWNLSRAGPAFWLRDWDSMSSRQRRRCWQGAGFPNCPVRGCQAHNHVPPHRPVHSMTKEARDAWLTTHPNQAQKRPAETPAETQAQVQRGDGTVTVHHRPAQPAQQQQQQQPQQQQRQYRPTRRCNYCRGWHFDSDCPHQADRHVGRAIFERAARLEREEREQSRRGGRGRGGRGGERGGRSSGRHGGGGDRGGF